MSRSLLVFLVLVVASLLAFGAVADRALEGQAQRARDAATQASAETARLTGASVRAALAALEQDVVAGRRAPGVVTERLAAVPVRWVPARPAPPYRGSRGELARLLRSTGTTPSGLPVAVVARLALGDAALFLPGEGGAPDVTEQLLSGRLPVRAEDLPALARALGAGGDPRVGALQARLRQAPEASTLPAVPTFRRARVDDRVEGWARDRGDRVRYLVPLDRLLALAKVADRAQPAAADRDRAPAPHTQRTITDLHILASGYLVRERR